jgi:hypothetical protein
MVQDPFLIYRLVDDIVTYPCGNDDIQFVVDNSKRCARVQEALSDASNVFSYEGTIQEPRGLWEPNKWMPLFHGALSEEEQEKVSKSLEQKELPIDALLKVASPAPFGRDGKAIFDPEVRKAFEIPRSRLPSDLLKVLDLNSSWRNMYETEVAMKPASKKWIYQLYKIHLYGPGGKFEDHVDTLHQNNHVATVVLSLPSEHVGGILRVRHHGETMEFDSAKGPIQDKYGSGRSLRYGAFFTDCTHSVQEVVSGWRVVVQYDVYEEVDDAEIVNEDDKADNVENQGDDEEIDSANYNHDTIELVVDCLEDCHTWVGTSKIHNKEQTPLIQAVLQYMTTIPPTHGVAFFLRHQYSLPALNEVVLKGADRVIFDAFSKRGDLSISIQGVLVYVETRYLEQVSVYVAAVSLEDFLPTVEDDEEEGNDENEDEKKGKDEDDDEDNDEDNDQRSTDSPDSISAATGKDEASEKSRVVHLIVDEKNGATRIHDCGQTGNEPADGYTSYFVACMIIRPIEKENSAAMQQSL